MLVLSLMLRNPSFATWHRCWWRWKSPQQQRRRRRRQWRRRQQLSQVPCLLQVWPACTMPASWPALLACLLQYLYFHDSNEVVIHFSVKLMMLQNLLDLLTLKRWFNQYWLKIIDYVFFFQSNHAFNIPPRRRNHSHLKKIYYYYYIHTLLLGIHTYNFSCYFLQLYSFLYIKTKKLILYTQATFFHNVRQASKSQQETCSNRNIATKIWWHFLSSPVHDTMYI